MAETENTSIINMAETENTSTPSEKTQLINLRGLNTFMEESIKIFEPTLPEGTDGQVLKLTEGKPSWGTDNTPTTFAWTEGTSEGPAGTLSGDGMSSVSFAAIPSASETSSGVVTTGAQTFAGGKTFSETITGDITGNANTATTADKTAHSLSVKDGAATPVAAINSWNGSVDKTLTIKGESPVTTTATDGAITITHATSGVTAGTYKSVTVDAKGHVTGGTNPSTLNGYGITDAKIENGAITLGTKTITPLTSSSTLAASKVSGTLATSNIPNLDASKITSGTISIERLPATALERCVVVANDTARFALTTASVQVGDTVKVTDTKKMYMVVDSSKLSTEAGYEEYFTSTDWSTITNKPSSFTPAAHSHDAATQSVNGFMSAADKTKLDGIATGANNYTHPAYTAKSSGFYKVAVDGTGHVSATTAVTKDDITSLGIPGSDTNTHYTAVPVLGASSDTSNATSVTLNPYLNIIENNVKSGGIQIKGDGATSIRAINGVVTISSTDNDTTYESKTAASGGTDVSLVTTGEKYTWNNKADAFTVSSDNPTATWSSEVTVGTVAGTELKFVMPANPSSGGEYLPLSGGTVTGATSFTNTTASTSTSTGAVTVSGGLGVAGHIYAGAVHNAVWNDLVDCMEVPEDTSLEYGYCYSWEGDNVIKSSRSSKNCIGIHSNTAGFVMGEKKTKTIQAAVAGFVLAYVDKLYPEGTPLTWGDDGVLTKCSSLKRILHPERVIATFYREEKKEKWHDLPVLGRHWVKVV